MRKSYKIVISLLLAVMLLSSLGVCAFADSVLTYGSNRSFNLPAGTDLFTSFKNVMPGDQFTETITVRNEYTGSKYVYIYVQAVPHDPAVGPHVSEVAANENYESMMDFLSQMNLTVTHKGRVISDDTADKTAGLTKRHLIGVFSGKGQATIQATLTVPITMGNEYAERFGEVDWIFTAEERSDSSIPVTGDNSNLFLWIGIMSCSFVISAALLIFMLKKKRAE